MNKQQPNTIWDVVLAAVMGVLGLTSISIGSINVEVKRDVTPVEVRQGWTESLVDKDSPKPAFAVMSSAGSGEGSVVKLWDYSKAINGGNHFPTFRQQVGDCVANGAANALNYLQAVQIAKDNPDQEWRSACRQWIYGVSRTDPEIGKGRLGRGDGSVGSWAAKACELRGVLADDHEGVPTYSGAIAREWGFKGPPQQFYPVAEEFRIRSTAAVSSYNDVRDALANGYPVTIASNVGFEMEPIVRDGKHWGKRSGSWAHQMCLIAIDDTAISPFDRKKGAAYCLNSWGEAAHGKPADDAPPGGFWIDRTTIEKIVGQGDSWAYSNFDGFPARNLNFNVFGSSNPQQIATFLPDAPEIGRLSEQLAGVTGSTAYLLGGAFSIGSAAALVRARRRRQAPSVLVA